ncbi:MAG: hypothetical protein ABI317_11550 [Gaiellales bacterium]
MSRTAMVAGTIGVLVIAGVVVLVIASGGSSAPLQLTTPVAAAKSRFPAPPSGAVVFAREDSTDVLALAVVRRTGDDLELQASDVGQQGTGVSGLRVSFAVTAGGAVHTADAAPCGDGCYRAHVSLSATPATVRVDVVRSARTTHWVVPLPRPWPAPDASALVARAARVWTSLTSLSYTDRLGSDASHVVRSHWQIVAPDRLAYQIEQGGGQAVIVGVKRWDRATGEKWQESPAVRLHQPEPFWVSATDAHIVGSGRFDGRPVWRVSFYDPRTPGWFLISIDKGTSRTLDLHMLATAHFMHDSYGQFNAPIKIVPPTSNR